MKLRCFLKPPGCACCYTVKRAETATHLLTHTTQAIPRSGRQECAYLMMADTLVILLKKSNSRW